MRNECEYNKTINKGHCSFTSRKQSKNFETRKWRWNVTTRNRIAWWVTLNPLKYDLDLKLWPWYVKSSVIFLQSTQLLSRKQISAVVCQERTVASWRLYFLVVVWQWLGDRDCTAQYNCCLPATPTTDCRRFCRFCLLFFLILYGAPAMSLTW